MAKIFLDANILIDLVEPRSTSSIEDFKDQDLFLSPLSVHILFYVTKRKMPQAKISDIVNFFTIVSFDEHVVERALIGPTTDFEDNAQLHGAANAHCDIFLTHDKRLLKLGTYGEIAIRSTLPKNN